MKPASSFQVIVLAIGVLAFTAAAHALPPGDPGVIADGEVELWLHPDGTAALVDGASGQDINSYEVQSPNGLLIPESPPDPAPFDFYGFHSATMIVGGALGTWVHVPDVPGVGLNWGWDAAAPLSMRDVSFQYFAFSAAEALEGDVCYVPEPVSAGLLGLGAVAVLRRRRRRRRV